MPVDWRNCPGVDFNIPYIEGTTLGMTVKIYALDYTYRYIMLDRETFDKSKIPAKTFYMKTPPGNYLYGNVKKKPAKEMIK